MPSEKKIQKVMPSRMKIQKSVCLCEKKIQKGNTVPVEMKIQNGNAGEKKIHKVMA